jgi:hypothetical protein
MRVSGNATQGKSDKAMREACLSHAAAGKAFRNLSLEMLDRIENLSI